MPKGVDHATWERAKKQAKEQGKGTNWPYVMSIYQNMKGASDTKEKVKKKYARMINAIGYFLSRKS